MNIQQIVTGKAWKAFMAKLYGFGAAVVIVGALFKIMHWPFAGIMLTVGLSVEAIIFFFSAFEPPHAEPDWSLVYPELAGMYEPDEDLFKDIDDIDDEEDEDGDTAYEPEGDTVSEQLDNMLKDANIDKGLIENLGKGLKSLSDNTAQLSDVSNASVATNEYVENMKGASASASELTDSYKKTSEGLEKDAEASEEYVNNIKTASESAGKLSESYLKTNEIVNNEVAATEEYISNIKSAADSAGKVAEKYNEAAEQLAKTANDISQSVVDGSLYNDKIQEISKNLSALNAVYELQLQSSNEQIQVTGKLQEGLGKYIENFNETVENTMKYKEQSAVLAQNISALNQVYGNMLSAMASPPKA